MAKPAVQSVPADIMAFVKFMQDSDAVAAKLGEIHEATEDCIRRIELVGKADEIEPLHLNAKQAEAAAQKMLADAKDQAKTIIAAAEEKIQKRDAESMATHDKRKTFLEDRMKELKLAEDAHALATAKLENQQEAVKKSAAEAQAKHETAVKLMTEASAWAARLKAAVAG